MLGDPKKKRGGKKDDVVVVAADEIHSKLSGEEARRCRNLFKTFDQEGQDTIDAWELRLALEAFGLRPTDADVTAIMDDLAVPVPTASASQLPLAAPESAEEQAFIETTLRLDFSQFLRAVQRQKRAEQSRTYKEADLVGAFTAVGGNADKSGRVSLVNLQKILKDDFGLTLKFEELIDELDSDDKDMDFAQFASLFGSN